jgi:hypothetical protein
LAGPEKEINFDLFSEKSGQGDQAAALATVKAKIRYIREMIDS